MLFPTTLAGYVLAVLAFIASTFANTEIVNFAAPAISQEALPLELATWPVLYPNIPSETWSLQHAPSHTAIEPCTDTSLAACPHERWAILDLDGHGGHVYSRFTLRISWPASHPVDISLQVHTLQTIRATFGIGDTGLQPQDDNRRLFAHMIVVHSGVQPSSPDNIVGRVPVIITLEPLCFGVLPSSVILVLLFLAPIVTGAVLVVVPRIKAELSRVVRVIQLENQDNDMKRL